MSQRTTGPENRTQWSARDARRGLIDAALGGTASRRAVLAAIAAAIGGGAAGAADAQGKGKKRQAQPKFFICHDGRTLLLPAPAARAHLKHGDTVGPCGGLEGGGACVPLLQTCVPLVGNPCCDKNAACVVSAAGDAADVPDFACRDTAACTSDAACQAKFPDAGPDIVCAENTGGSFCGKEVPGTGRCCRRRDCSKTNPCEGGICCGLDILHGGEVCCAPGQQCLTFLGCTAL